MKFGVPMSNPSPDLTDKVKATFLSQVSEIANQVCDGMLVAGAAVPLITAMASAAQAMWSALSVMLFPSGLPVHVCNILKSNRIIAGCGWQWKLRQPLHHRHSRSHVTTSTKDRRF